LNIEGCLKVADFLWKLVFCWQWGSWCSCFFHVNSSMDQSSKLLHCRLLEAMVSRRPSCRV